MNAPRVVSILCISLLVSYHPHINAMEPASKKKEQKKHQPSAWDKKVSDNAVPAQEAAPSKTLVAPESPKQPQATQATPQAQATAEQTLAPSTPPTTTTPANIPTTQQVPAPQTQPEQQKNEQSQPHPQTAPTTGASQQPNSQESGTVTAPNDTFTIKVKRPESDENAPKNILTKSKAEWAVDYSANPTLGSDDDRLTGLNRGINELANNAKYYLPKKNEVSTVDLRYLIDRWKTYNKNLTDIIANLYKNKIQIPDVKLQQAAQTIQFANEAFYIPYLFLVTKEVSDQVTTNIAALKTLDGLRKNKKPVWLSEAEQKMASALQEYVKDLAKYLETPAGSSHLKIEDESSQQ